MIPSAVSRRCAGTWGIWFLLAGIGLTRSAPGWAATARGCLWTLAELWISLIFTVILGTLGTFATGTRAAKVLDLGISRGLEVAAALPIVLACSILEATWGWRLPVAVALVVGLFNGLRCLRVVTVTRLSAPRPRRRTIPLLRRVTSIRHAWLTSAVDLIPELIVVEASIEFLGFCRSPVPGGIGQHLGVALSTRNTLGIASMSFIAVGLTVLARRLLQGRDPSTVAAAPGSAPDGA